MTTLKTIFFFIVLSLGISACSMDASILNLEQASFESLNRKSPDLIHGEVVTTPQGHQLTGVFGEISEKTTSITGNQWQFEGVFYE